jgi:hypothetical protein
MTGPAVINTHTGPTRTTQAGVDSNVNSWSRPQGACYLVSERERERVRERERERKRERKRERSFIDIKK